MKRFIIILFFHSTVFMPVAVAQKNTSYMFEEFQDAIFYFQGGIRSQAKVNYNLMDGMIYFIDQDDGLVKMVTNTDKINVVKIGERNFVTVRDGIQEVMPTDPPIYVQYMARTKMKAQKGAYGTETETSSITTYSEMRDGQPYNVQEREFEAIGRYNMYWIEKNGKKIKFLDFKQFLKIYPKHKDALDSYIKSNRIDFNETKDIVALCLYAENLDK